MGRILLGVFSLLVIFVVQEGANMATSDVLIHRTTEYRVIYAKREDQRDTKAVYASVTVTASNLETGQRLWKRELDSLWGHYRDWSYKRLGFTVEQFLLAQDNEGTSYLFVRTASRKQFVLDPLTGMSFIARFRDRYDAVPVAQNVELRLVGLDLTGIQAVPGYGVRARVKNGRHTALLVEPGYVSFQLEGFIRATQEWEKITESHLCDDYVQTTARDGVFDLFIPAEALESLLNQAYSVFESALKRGAKRMQSLVGMDISQRLKLTSGAFRSTFDGFRLVLVLLLPGNARQPISGAYRACVPLQVEAISSLLSGE
ncbi:hypothetical protein ACFL6C_10155 [Myxococcota bacterium]